MKYKVPFNGFVYVEADSPEEATSMAEDGDTIYEETDYGHPCEVEDFTVEVMA